MLAMFRTAFLRPLLVCGCMLATLSVWAESAKTVEIDFEKKIIYADSLSLPKNINVGALLRLLPELLQRPGESVLSNYEIQIEDVAMGEASDVVLTVIQLADIEKIEVKESPLSTDLNNGQSGSINICLRPLAKKRLGLTGTASLSLSNETSVMPNVLMDFHGKKLSVRGMAFGEWYDHRATVNETGPNEVEQRNHERYTEQMMRALICYQPDARNVLTLTLTEATCNDKEMREDIISKPKPQHTEEMTTRNRNLQLMSHLKYVHSFTQSRGLEAKAHYIYNPHRNRVYHDTDIQLDVNNLRCNNWQTSVEYFDALSLAKGRGRLKYKVGASAALSHQDNNYESAHIEPLTSDDGGTPVLADRNYHTFTTSEEEVRNVMPFAELVLLYGPVSAKLGAEYQWSNKVDNSDWTGRMVMDWEMSEANHLRLLLNRQLRRPSMISQEVGVDYIANFGWGLHRLTTNVGLNYGMVDGVTIEKSHFTTLNLMAVYQYDYFFLSVTGNQYRKEQRHDTGEHSYYSYYNLSVMPSFNFSNGFRTALNLRYYSRVEAQDLTQSDCMTLQMNLGKSWGRWNAYVYGRVPVTTKTKVVYADTGSALSYELVSASMGTGLSYRF